MSSHWSWYVSTGSCHGSGSGPGQEVGSFSGQSSLPTPPSGAVLDVRKGWVDDDLVPNRCRLLCSPLPRPTLRPRPRVPVVTL